MIVEQLIIILGIFLEGEYALGSTFPITGHLNRKLMMEGKTEPSNAEFVLYISAKCAATQLTDTKIATTRNDCEGTKACKKPAGGGGGGGGGGGATGATAATTAKAAGADDSVVTGGAASGAPPPQGGGGGAEGEGCEEIGEGQKAENLELYTYEFAGKPVSGAGGDSGPCFVISFAGGATSKGKAQCTVSDTVEVKGDGIKLCPGDSGAPVVNDANELMGILNKIDACGESATAIKGTTAMDAVKAGPGGDGGEGGPSTPTDGSPSITASMIVIGFTGILITLFA